MMSGFEMVPKLLNPLYKLQVDYLKLEAEFYKEVHALECKYERLYKPIYDKRAKILSGQYEPLEDDYTDMLSRDSSGTLGDIENSDFNTERSYFWLTVLKNAKKVANIIQPEDEPMLKYLTDISVDLSESDPMAFTLQFHFAPNDYFTNTVLTKEFLLDFDVPDADPLSFDGPEIVACKGCHIDWKEGFPSRNANQDDKNMDVPTSASFFDFFKLSKPSSVDEEAFNEEDSEKEYVEDSNLDFAIGHFIRERIVPRAVMYFTEDFTVTMSDMESELASLLADLKNTSEVMHEDDDEEETGAGEAIRQAQTVEGVDNHEEKEDIVGEPNANDE